MSSNQRNNPPVPTTSMVGKAPAFPLPGRPLAQSVPGAARPPQARGQGGARNRPKFTPAQLDEMFVKNLAKINPPSLLGYKFNNIAKRLVSVAQHVLARLEALPAEERNTARGIQKELQWRGRLAMAKQIQFFDNNYNGEETLDLLRSSRAIKERAMGRYRIKAERRLKEEPEVDLISEAVAKLARGFMDEMDAQRAARAQGTVGSNPNVEA